MRKLILPLLAALFLAAPLSAQHFGLRAGVNATDASIDFGDLEVDTDGETNLFDDENTDVRQNYVGINGGVMVPIGN
jgi:hypothetical protein